jgi:hypothetical protein
VATNVLGKSGRAMLEDIITGEDDPEHLASLALGHLRVKIPQLRLALAWIIHEVSSQKRKDALKGMMHTGFADPAFLFGASIA